MWVSSGIPSKDIPRLRQNEVATLVKSGAAPKEPIEPASKPVYTFDPEEALSSLEAIASSKEFYVSAAYRQPLSSCDEDSHSYVRDHGEANSYLSNITAAHYLSFCKRINDETKEEEVVVYEGDWKQGGPQCKRLNLVFTDDQLLQLGIHVDEPSFFCKS